MKRSAHELDAENPVRNDKKKCMDEKLCPPFCVDDCPYRGSHDQLVLSLVNLQEKTVGLEEWKTKVCEARESRNLNQPLEDPNREFRYPLLHWAAMLGKVKAVTWLLQQEFISFIQNPAQLVCSPSNVSNETVLFSMARFLHEGVKSRSTGDILDKYFVKILDAFLKHDPKVLLVQEGHNKDTVLHLCARREEDSTSPSSTAPFFKYLKRILGKLEEYSTKKDSPLPLVDVSNILQTRNEEGDAFIHLLARSTTKRDDARKLIDFAKDKFNSLGSLTNSDKKTVEVIWKEFKPNPEVYQTSSQEMHDTSDKEDEDKEDEEPSQKLAIHGPVSTSGEQGCSTGGSEEDDGVERLQIQGQGLLASQWNTGLHPNIQFDGGRGDKGDEPDKEPFSDKTSYYSISLQSEVEGIEGPDVLQTEEPNEAQESDLHGAGISSPDPSVSTQPGSNTDTQGKAQDAVRKLIDETELELSQDKSELEQAQKVLNECEERLKQLRAEKKEKEAVVSRLQEEVQNKEDNLKRYKSALQTILK